MFSLPDSWSLDSDHSSALFLSDFLPPSEPCLSSIYLKLGPEYSYSPRGPVLLPLLKRLCTVELNCSLCQEQLLGPLREGVPCRGAVPPSVSDHRPGESVLKTHLTRPQLRSVVTVWSWFLPTSPLPLEGYMPREGMDCSSLHPALNAAFTTDNSEYLLRGHLSQPRSPHPSLPL